MLHRIIPALALFVLAITACDGDAPGQADANPPQDPTSEASVAAPEEPNDDLHESPPTAPPTPTQTPTDAPTATDVPDDESPDSGQQDPNPDPDPGPDDESDDSAESEDATEEVDESDGTDDATDEVDEDEVEAVFAGLMAGQTEMLREVSAEGEMGETYELYSDSLFAPAWQPSADALWEMFVTEGFESFHDDVQVPDVVVTELIDVTEDCVHFLAGHDADAWFSMDVDVTTDDAYPRAIVRADDDIDTDINPTGWLLLGDAVFLATLELDDPCG